MTALAAMAAGGHGCISVTANIAPAPCAELMEATFKDDWDHALKIQDRLAPLHVAIFAEPGVNGAKYALSLLGRARAENSLAAPSGQRGDRSADPARHGARGPAQRLREQAP